MNELRNLLIDCRIELRKQVKDFHKTELCDRLDAAITKFTHAPQDTSVSEPAIGANKAVTTNQVGLAWQRAARDLRFTHPDLFEKLGKDVIRLLDTKTLVDPGTELEERGVEVEKLKTVVLKQRKVQGGVQAELETLLGALATAVPHLDDASDRFATAMARIEWLRTSIPVSQSRDSKGGRRGNDLKEGAVPSDETLAAVIAGFRIFSKEQLDWALGETMILCGFELTPNELLEKGQPHIAKLIQDARSKKG